MQRIRELTHDYTRVWAASGTAKSARKCLIGLLTEGVTLTRDGFGLQADVRLR